MNCPYITLFFKIVAGIVQTFINSWNQLLYPQVIEVCRQAFEPRHDFFFLHFIIVVELFSKRGVSLGKETSGNRWSRGPDCTAVGPIQWRTQEFFSGGVQQIQLRTEERENGDLGEVAP